MKNLKDIVLERLVLSKTNNRDDFNIINKLLDGRSLDLERLFSGKNKNVNKTYSNGTIWFLDNKNPGESFELICSDKYGNTSDVGTIRNNDELYDFLSSRLKNSTEKEFIDILIDYLRDHFVQENINERLVLSKHRPVIMYDELFKKLREWSPECYNDVYFERIYDKTIKVKINGTDYDLESIGWNKEKNCVELCTYPSVGETPLTFWFIENDDDIIKYLGGDDEDEIFAKQCVKKLIEYIDLRIKIKNKI